MHRKELVWALTPARLVVMTVVLAALLACQGTTDIAAPPSVPTSDPVEAQCPNTVAVFIEGAEQQCEDCAAIERALADLATKPIAELRAARYADYQGESDAWDLQTVLLKHLIFGPDYKTAVQSGCCDVGGECFWSLLDEDVRAAARARLAP